MKWLVAAGLHPRAGASTLRVAEDLATRMDYDTGHARYCLDGITARTGLSRATVKRHVAVLRELGALAWAVHGTRRNVRRALGLRGYAGTATVYAAVIPPVYDRALGHRIDGSGYEARIIVDQRRQVKPVDNSLVDNPSSSGLEPPSLTRVGDGGKVEVDRGSNYTPRRRAVREKPTSPSTTTGNSQRRTAADVERAVRLTRVVRALVNWTQKVPLRRLEFVLRPLTDRGMDAYAIAAELTGMIGYGRWRPRRPAEFIHAALTAEHRREEDRRVALAEAGDPLSNPAWQAWLARWRHTDGAPARGYTDEERRAARMISWDRWGEVAAHYDEDPDDALDLYGSRLCIYAVRCAARDASQEARG